MERIITGGTLVLENNTSADDLLIVDDKIREIGPNLTEKYPQAEIIDASDMLVFPGFIDPHTHLDMDVAETRTADTFETGTKAALAGGTTTVLDFAGQDPGVSIDDTLKLWHERADGKSSCNYGFHIGLGDWSERTQEELKRMEAEGISSIKIYMAYAMRLTDDEIYEILKYAKEHGMVVSCHCENGLLVSEMIKDNVKAGNLTPHYHPLSRPDAIEAEAINRFLTIAEETGTTVYVVHLSTKRGLEVIEQARDRGQNVLVETCPQYLVLDDSMYDLPDFEGAKYVFAPPARKKADQDAIRTAIMDEEIQTAGSDHCSFNFETDKKIGIDDFSRIPNGIPGVETRPQIFFTELRPGHDDGMDLNAFSDFMATNAAKIYGMYPRKGVLAEGSDADITIWDPDYEGVIENDKLHMNVDYSPYEGLKVKGQPVEVILNGKTAFRDGEIVLENGGEYIRRDFQK